MCIRDSTQTPLALFLHFDLAEMTDRANTEAIAEKLMINVRDHGWKLTTGFIGVNALVPALSNNGQMEAALRLLEQDVYKRQGRVCLRLRVFGYIQQK